MRRIPLRVTPLLLSVASDGNIATEFLPAFTGGPAVTTTMSAQLIVRRALVQYLPS